MVAPQDKAKANMAKSLFGGLKGPATKPATLVPKGPQGPIAKKKP